jgi:hypothetical protein
MILRSLKLVHFRGLPEVVLKDAPSEGVVRVALPHHAEESVVADAVVFALGGTVEGDLVDGDQGFAYVELGLSFSPDIEGSLFRGIDRRGVVQTSLREQGGERVTGGVDAVAARLAELIGTADLGAWAQRAIVDADGAPAVSLAVSLAGSPSVPTPGDTERCAELVETSHEVIHDLQRGLRVERLGHAAARVHGELLAHGARLRRERAEVDRVVERETAERDRVRTRLRRVNEFRDQAARSEARDAGDRAAAARQGKASGPGLGAGLGPRRGDAVEWGIAACAALLLATLALYVTAASGDPDRPLVTVGLGLAFAIAVSSYFVVSGTGAGPEQTPASSGASADQAARAWKDALRHRFADLSDPDDPGLPRRLRERLANLDAKLAPLHARLEALDDAITVFDVEAGRAARALHQSLPDPELADDGLAQGMDDRAAMHLVRELGDTVYAMTVERDALMAGGVVETVAARRALAEVLRSLARGDGQRVAEALRQVDALSAEDIDDPSEGERVQRLIDFVATLASEYVQAVALQASPQEAGPDQPRFVVMRATPPGGDSAAPAFVKSLRDADPTVRQVVFASRLELADPDGGDAAEQGIREPQGPDVE